MIKKIATKTINFSSGTIKTKETKKMESNDEVE
jgi:hypothetical protein